MNTKIKIILLVLVLLFLVMTFFIVINIGNILNREKLTTGQVIINDQVINVQVSKTIYQQITGLSNRDSLDANSGMLFVYGTYKIRSFWMNEMNFPLDIIWIRDDAVVDISANLPASLADQKELPTYQPKIEVNYVLEVNSGFAELHNIQIGDKVSIKAQ